MRKAISVLVILLMILLTVNISLGAAQCDDGIDNDDDTLIDFPADPDCINAEDPSEGSNVDLEIPDEPVETSNVSVSEPEEEKKKLCDDGIDNDQDGFIDYPSDPGCETLEDNDEHNAAPSTTEDSGLEETADEPEEEKSSGGGGTEFPWGMLIVAAPVVLAMVAGAKAKGSNDNAGKQLSNAAKAKLSSMATEGTGAPFGQIFAFAGAPGEVVTGALKDKAKTMTIDKLAELHPGLKGISVVKQILGSGLLNSKDDNCKDKDINLDNYKECGYISVSPDGEKIEGKGDVPDCDTPDSKTDNLNGLVLGNNHDSKWKVSGCSLGFDSKDGITTLTSRGEKSSLSITPSGEGSKELKYAQMKEGSTLKVDKKTGMVSEANITVSGEEPVSYTFGDNTYENIPPGTEVIYKDGKVIMNNPNERSSSLETTDDCKKCKPIEIKNKKGETIARVRSWDKGKLKFNPANNGFTFDSYSKGGSVVMDFGGDTVDSVRFKTLSDGKKINFKVLGKDSFTLREGDASVLFEDLEDVNGNRLDFDANGKNEIDFLGGGETPNKERNYIQLVEIRNQEGEDVEGLIPERGKIVINTVKDNEGNNIRLPVGKKDVARPSLQQIGQGNANVEFDLSAGKKGVDIDYTKGEKGSLKYYYDESESGSDSRGRVLVNEDGKVHLGTKGDKNRDLLNLKVKSGDDEYVLNLGSDGLNRFERLGEGDLLIEAENGKYSVFNEGGLPDAPSGMRGIVYDPSGERVYYEAGNGWVACDGSQLSNSEFSEKCDYAETKVLEQLEEDFPEDDSPVKGAGSKSVNGDGAEPANGGELDEETAKLEEEAKAQENDLEVTFDSEKGNEVREEGVKLHKEGDLNGALKKFKEAQTLGSDNENLNLNLARTYDELADQEDDSAMEMKYRKEAVKYYSKVEENLPSGFSEENKNWVESRKQALEDIIDINTPEPEGENGFKSGDNKPEPPQEAQFELEYQQAQEELSKEFNGLNFMGERPTNGGEYTLYAVSEDEETLLTEFADYSGKVQYGEQDCSSAFNQCKVTILANKENWPSKKYSDTIHFAKMVDMRNADSDSALQGTEGIDQEFAQYLE